MRPSTRWAPSPHGQTGGQARHLACPHGLSAAPSPVRLTRCSRAPCSDLAARLPPAVGDGAFVRPSAPPPLGETLGNHLRPQAGRTDQTNVRIPVQSGHYWNYLKAKMANRHVQCQTLYPDFNSPDADTAWGHLYPGAIAGYLGPGLQSQGGLHPGCTPEGAAQVEPALGHPWRPRQFAGVICVRVGLLACSTPARG